jgi:NADH-quinone oxidoreductase subunit L
MPNTINIILILILPFISFLLLGLLGRKYFNKIAGIIGTALLFVATILALHTAYEYFFVYGKVADVYQSFIPLQFHWLQFTANLSIDMGLTIDAISVMMLVVVTFISLMVHVYSLEYMKGDPRFSVYYSFLGLFTFSMLGLVLAANIFQIYIFWELVGVSSFLLIGYYYEKPSAVAASKKAFIVTRFADFGFLIGILILSYYADTLNFSTLIERLTAPESNQLKMATTATFLGMSALTWGAILVFVGGAGKSAMFPLHIWLPDAMEGPTPVSALIHAATMVVAGVYLVARLFPVFAIGTPVVLEGVGWVGAVSAVFAAVIACTQTDIKRVLAYSTMSQIGFMMFALGVSKYGGEEGLGYTASLFHLFTHAMFKALLFLGAGSVIHFVHSNEMYHMGGLRKLMPVTHITFLIACLAIAGVPPLAGFFSKEEILLAAYQHNKIIYGVALATSGLTAFYMFRLYFSIFWNKEHVTHEEHHSEGAGAMKIPLILLAVGAVFTGFIPFGKYVSTDGKMLESHFYFAFSVLPVMLGVAGILIAMLLYKKQNNRPDKLAITISGIYKATYHKFYIDELYVFLTKKILFNLVGKPFAWFDKTVIDGIVNQTASITQSIADGIKKMQSGKVQLYAIYFLVGVIALAILLIYVW